jgi:TPR repeat protein
MPAPTPLKLLFWLLLWSLSTAPRVQADPLTDGLAAFRQRDYAQAQALWRPLAETGNDDAQYNLGLLHHKGWGTAIDLKQAHEWYTRAANQGNPDAMYNLGVMYLIGEGVFPSPRQALELFTHAANRQHPPSLYNLGVMHAYGMGCQQDAERAVELWTRAVELGSAEARAALVQAYTQGLTGLPADERKATHWLEQGHHPGRGATLK